ncbi:MAG: hypothetical protein LBS05_05920 [Tannerellaceae bacterium]|jgi:hypothetical protein|nr:hypothetical protein [Tannerellaceae bacterium]
MKQYILFLTLALLAFAPVATAQVSTQGTDFYVAFGRNAKYENVALTFQIRIVATQAADVTLTFKAGIPAVNLTIDAGEVYTYQLSNVQRDSVYSGDTGTSNRSLRIQSTTPVSVYALNQRSATTDATNLLPVDNLGTDYYQISYIGVNTNFADGYEVVATQDGTNIYEDGTWMATLDAGQVYAAYYHGADLTGSHITSDKPIAHFVTNDCTNVPTTAGACDCLFQQTVPVNAWGNTFLVPVTRRGRERIRIVASQDNTTVSQTGGVIKTDGGGGAQNPTNTASFVLNAGQYAEFEITLAGGGGYVTADRPVAVAAYLTGTTYSGLTVSNGDPAMAWVSPIEQTINGAAIAPFAPLGTTNLNEHHALIVTATATRDQTTVAIGTAPPDTLSEGTWTTGNGTAGSALSFYSMPLTDWTASYYFANPNGLVVMGYGLGSAESYYYLAGASTRNLDVAFYVNDVHYQDVDGEVFCEPQSFAFRAAIQYAMSTTPGYLRWYINGTEMLMARDLLEWNYTLPPATYEIEVSVLDLQNQTHTISTTFTVNSPLAPGVIGTEQVVCTGTAPAALTLTTPPSGGAGVYTYQWQTSADGVTWTDIPGATQASYTPDALTSTTYFRLAVTSGTCGTEATAPVLITVSSCVMPVNPHLRSQVMP